MKISKTALLAAIACAFGGTGLAQTSPQTNANSYGYYSDSAAPVVSSSTSASKGNVRTVSASMAEVIPASCSCSDAPISGCDSGCGPSGCDGGCDSAGCGADEPWRLFSGNPLGLTIGGWSNIGYHTANNVGLGIIPGANNVPANFNNYADRVQLQQQWLYAEKIADGSCGLGFGGRIDYLYGTDAPDTQAFGIPVASHWDNGWDNGGAYGHAIPQLYGEAAVGNLSVKVGHFFTIVGQEVVGATGNFFYSRQFTFYNAEPFTHTGALTTYKVDDQTTLWNGYVLGWDSAFRDNGDAYIGGFSRALTDDISFIYTTTLGRLNDSFGERGGVHSGIVTVGLTDKLKYIGQNDYLFTQNAGGGVVRNTFGSIHYLLYALNDKVTLGSRSEWFNVSTAAINNSDVLNQTVGINYRTNANLLFRPEVRWVWDKDNLGVNENLKSSQAFFGMDAIFTF
jgi:Putative beta-barrel porin-2, OmpL-like. bbp2